MSEAPTGPAPGFVARVGLAIAHPRWALTVAADRRAAGRSGSDLIALLAILLAATQLRGLFASAWLGIAVEPLLGARALMHVLTRALTVDLGFLVLAALVLYLGAGPKRNLGRAFDLACVAALPLVFVDLGATGVVRAIDLASEVSVPQLLSMLLALAAYAWAGSLVALAMRPARIAPTRVPMPPPRESADGRRAGRAVLLVALVGLATQGAWIARNLDMMRPMTQGDAAPALALRTIGPGGALGAPIALDDLRGHVVVLDFWATWCGPCLAAMPRLDRLARAHPDVRVLAIALDAPAAARTLFDERGYAMTLVADDGNASERFGVTTIPHTVVLDRAGVVQNVFRGQSAELEPTVEKYLSK